jgi:hypothetical protein
MEVRKMAEKQYKYTTKIKQPQKVVNIKLDPNGGVLSEREYKTVKKDAYGASLLEKGLLIVEEASATAAELAAADQSAATKSSNEAADDGASETIPDLEVKDKPEDHTGWRPE